MCKTSCEAVFQSFMSFIVVGFLITLVIERFAVEPFLHTHISYSVHGCHLFYSGEPLHSLKYDFAFLLFSISMVQWHFNEKGSLSITRISRNIGERWLIHNQFWNAIIKNGSEYVSAVSHLKIEPISKMDWQNWISTECTL